MFAPIVMEFPKSVYSSRELSLSSAFRGFIRLGEMTLIFVKAPTKNKSTTADIAIIDRAAMFVVVDLALNRLIANKRQYWLRVWL